MSNTAIAQAAPPPVSENPDSGGCGSRRRRGRRAAAFSRYGRRGRGWEPRWAKPFCPCICRLFWWACWRAVGGGGFRPTGPARQLSALRHAESRRAALRMMIELCAYGLFAGLPARRKAADDRQGNRGAGRGAACPRRRRPACRVCVRQQFRARRLHLDECGRASRPGSPVGPAAARRLSGWRIGAAMKTDAERALEQLADGGCTAVLCRDGNSSSAGNAA